MRRKKIDSDTDIRDVDIFVYAKHCVICDQPEAISKIKTWALNQGLTLQIIRTAYDREDHKKATELWGDKHYPAFVVYNDVTELEEFCQMITEAKNKMVKGENEDVDLQRRDAKDSVAKNKMVLEGEETPTATDKGQK